MLNNKISGRDWDNYALRTGCISKEGFIFCNTDTLCCWESHLQSHQTSEKGSEMLTHKKIRGGWSIGSYIDDIFAREGQGRKWREMRADVTFLFLRCGNGGMAVVVSGWAARQIRIRSRFQFLVDEQRGRRHHGEDQADREDGQKEGGHRRRGGQER